jgi:Transcription factor WhiB
MPDPWGDRSPSPSLCPSPGQRAAAELVINHRRSDHLIAEAARCSHSTVTHVRALLEEDGTIGYLEARDREHRTRTPCADPGPFIPAMPPQPAELRDGLCTRHPRPRMWESTRNPTDREAALALCHACPVLQPCRSWALSLPPYADRQIGILGGLLVADRDRLRKARREAAAARAARAATPPRRKRARRATPVKEPQPAIHRDRQPAVLTGRGSCASHPYPLWTSDGRAQREAAASDPVSTLTDTR